MAGFTKSFSETNNSKSEDGQIKIESTEKFQIKEEHDFKEWEQYDIITCKKHTDIETNSVYLDKIREILSIKQGQSVPI